ncbi:acyltransferase [Vibrio sp. UCD-FRSSP16_10]|uniref:1-acyl-sn-glycerol-3-phosphate acyltransferase n=1 Tax=unclassified Vibrio TaxID=2614977 RepID=UPI0008000A06|nr:MULTISPECIES: 1-acyl-sn-glycerol-3-phosphate acyltransferase [unclassified Vibrio]OBT08017.1 acyltransferase [Vibrio sp. UCD-FRSSP16_30]OBT17194.1 acyltransferase [Vibrio sp. UCD-FRSSP16_10]
MSTDNDIYQEIRPYNDEEIAPAIRRLIDDEEFISAILNYKFTNHAKWFQTLMSPLVKMYLKNRWGKLNSIDSVQIEVEKYLQKALDATTDNVTVTGLDKLDQKTPYLFISNHRDIAMDPALVNYGLHNTNHKTVRIAIGDNLLSKPCATELMKINKSFIVKRSAKGPREMLKTLGLLSSYIKHSLETGNSIWIAQKEGRAKDGNDFTDPAIIKMIQLEGRKRKMSFADYVRSIKIVPVAISYEIDPCDIAKANELHQKATKGEYQKSEFEDIDSIVTGITGYKGKINVSFGDVIDGDIDNPDELAAEIDRQIHDHYKLFPINLLASGDEANSEIDQDTRDKFEAKLAQLDEGARQYLIDGYANPVRNLSKDSSMKVA